MTNVLSASYVNLGTPADLQFGLGSFSVSMWLRLPTNALPGDLPFFGSATNSDNNFGFTFAPGYKTGSWEWCLDNAAGHSANPSGVANDINNGWWHSLIVTVNRSSNIASTYVNNYLVEQTGIAAIGSVNNGANIIIGQDPTFHYLEPGTATIDDLGVWKRVLTPTEVTQIYSAGATAGNSFNSVGPTPITISIAKSGTQLVLSYSSGTLYSSPTLGTGAVWTAVAGASPPSYTFTPGTGNLYFRVK